jgi:hypothetical protein
MANFAAFQITGSIGGLSPSSSYRYDALPGEVLTLQLEVPQPCLSVKYELFDPNNSESPRATFEAPDLQFGGGGYSKDLNPASSTATITLPTNSMDTHSWIVRATAVTDRDEVFERKVVLQMGKPAKIVPGETIQGGLRGWFDEVSKLIGSALPFYEGRKTTTNNSPINFDNGFMPPRSCNFELRGRLTAQRMGTAGDFKVWDILGGVRTDGSGVPSFIGSLPSFTLVRDMSGGGFAVGAPAIVISSNKLFPQVTGVAAQTIAWHCFWDMAIQVYA